LVAADVNVAGGNVVILVLIVVVVVASEPAHAESLPEAGQREALHPLRRVVQHAGVHERLDHVVERGHIVEIGRAHRGHHTFERRQHSLRERVCVCVIR
jgi:hypothetical protein